MWCDAHPITCPPSVGFHRLWQRANTKYINSTTSNTCHLISLFLCLFGGQCPLVWLFVCWTMPICMIICLLKLIFCLWQRAKTKYITSQPQLEVLSSQTTQVCYRCFWPLRQRPKNPYSKLALLSGKFLRVRKNFARMTKNFIPKRPIHLFRLWITFRQYECNSFILKWYDNNEFYHCLGSLIFVRTTEFKTVRTVLKL